MSLIITRTTIFNYGGIYINSMTYLSNYKKVLQKFKCEILDDNILFVKMLNEDYINSLTKYRYIKNQAKLIFSFLTLFILCFKKKSF